MSWTRRDRRTLTARHAALTATLAVAATLVLPGMPSAQAATVEAVLDGTVAGVNHGWTAASAAGTVALRRVTDVSGPFPAKTAMEISRAGGSGSWALALAPLRNPVSFFTVGKTYRMQAWVRDSRGSNQSIGILLANGNYAHRPADAAVYGTYTDTSWHLITRTFVATAAAHADTAVYLALPASGAFRFQVTGLTVREHVAAMPAKAAPKPDRVISFAGKAGTAPSASVWNHETGGNGWGNRELQTYTTSTANSYLDGAGRLAITARRQTVKGTDGITRDFTSARLTTQGKVTIKPGSYVESAIIAPVGTGVWPAFWLLGANVKQVGWPAAGELDILEGKGATPTIAHTAMHMSKIGAPDTDLPYGWGDAGGTTDLGVPLDSKAHRYGVYFDKHVVRFYIDRKPTMTFWASDAAASGRTWPFGNEAFIVLNVAMASSAVPARSAAIRTMTIGDISIYQGGTPF
ncbi:glycoside hydrolase family 16 protein [Catenuloplanes atrovinosus]|uniref:Beta-glucanase (GH16 family) n=1 Tax=Catenuloplanes atrovinosus TaxID=137266 RepID=A0AAE4CBR4_9ACTN|nr:glycoside hydrolase family 16 protein [Catenuloplanes atrovinosus]MDR7277214.1 beta-glucanase (GH16 family) [Catenuloplanes atrovinosus]